jgi:hypothetical protein
MKKLVLIITSLISLQIAKAQKNNISVSAGISLNGTGDTKGLIYSTEYSKYIKKSKFLWSTSFGGTIHDGSFPILYEYPTGVQNDGSVNYTIAGFQTAFYIGKNFLRNDSKEFIVKIGAVARYQSSSYWDVLNVLYPPLTGLPYPVVVFENSTPQKTVAIGVSSQIGYSVVISNNFTLGIIGGFQFDTQGDNLSYLTVKFGKRF